MKKKRQHPYKKHLNHKIGFDTEKVQVKPNFWLVHAGRLYCKDCGVQIKWLSEYEVDCINQWDFENRTLDYFLRNTAERTLPVADQDPDVIYLAVPFIEKDQAKKLGAQWHPFDKVWFTYRTDKNADKLYKWMMDDDIKLVESYKAYQRINTF